MEEKIHKRRVHYSGTHPKRFEEKYKEHDPEKYADTIEKVISKGSTPAGMHISICVNEILDFFRYSRDSRGLMRRLAMVDTQCVCLSNSMERGICMLWMLIR